LKNYEIQLANKKLGEIVEKPELKKAPIGSWPYVEIGDIDIENKSIIFKDKKSIRGAIIAPADSVLVSRVRPTRGAIVYIDKDYVVSSAFSILKPKLSESFSKFLFYWLGFSKNFFQYLQKKQKGSNYPSVRDKDILNFKIHIPSLKIQQKIVERLDAIKKAQELNDKQIELTEELFQSLLHRELDPKGKNWDFVKLGNVVQKIEYGLSVSVQNRLDENGVPILTMAEIENDGQINYQKTRKISASANELKKFKINKGELLFNWRNEKALIGKTGLFESEKDFIFASFLLRIVTNEKILPEFLWYWLNYLRTKNAYLQYAHLAGNQASYNANSLQNKISCPLILIKNQQKIVEKLSAVQEYKKKLLEQKQKLNELFESVLNKSMKRELIK